MFPDDFICRLCGGHQPGSAFRVREMMIGSREAFEYVQCGSCGSLQIVEIPADLQRHYPADYYSMADDHRPGLARQLKQWFVRRLYQIYSADIGPLRKLLPAPRRGDLAGLVAAGARKGDRILDVGCGAGAEFLRYLARIGFRNLKGADPFIPQEEIRHGSVTVVRRSISQIDESFDFVTLNHSLEHVPDPQADLRHVARVLRPGGKAIVRIPTPTSDAFERYQSDWVQLDAPRHLNLPSRTAMEGLLAKAGLTLEQRFDDSTGLQIYGSELYRRDIPLRSYEGYSAFDRRAMAGFTAEARQLNKASRGDQAVFIARK